MKSTYVVLLLLGYLYEQVHCMENDTDDLEERAQHGRRYLPMDVSNIDQQPDDIRCSETFSISQEGYLIFQLNSRKPCHYSFLGSKTEKCTATVYCAGKIKLEKPTKGNCDKEVFAITDGTEGFMSGCGTFHFGNTPRMPRSKGKDLYIYYKGISASSKCIVFCLEDLKNMGSLKPVKPVTANKKYKGLQMDNSCACGKTNEEGGRIVGGTAAIKFEFPWQAAIVYKDKGYERNPFCGGAIVNNQHILTAAHCFVQTGASADIIEIVMHAHVMDKQRDDQGRIPSDDDSEYKDIPGWTLPDETDQSEKSIRIEVESVLVHPLFDRRFEYDIAIIKLKTKLDFKKHPVSPICLPTIDESFDFVDGQNLLVTGWGRPSETAPAGSRTLQKLEVPYMNLTKCRQYTKATSRHLCAGYLEGKKDACSGDSGGPLMNPLTPSGSQYMLAGVVSAGKGCARQEQLGLYTNIQELVQWIYYHTDTAVWCPR